MIPILGKFNFKINVIPNGLEKCMSFNISNKLMFIDSFQCLSSSLDSLVKNLIREYFKYLSQEFDNKILDLVKLKGFYPYEQGILKSLKKNCFAKKNFIAHLLVRNDYEHAAKWKIKKF